MVIVEKLAHCLDARLASTTAGAALLVSLLSVPASAQPVTDLAGPGSLLPDRVAAPVSRGRSVAQGGPVRRLSADEAVDLALEQNLSIRVERLNPQIDDLSIAEARSAWTPNFTSGFSGFSRDTPANSFLSGGQERVSDDEFGTNIGVDQLLPWGGASYSASWDGTRSETTNIFSSFNPVLRSSLNLSFVQPLLRNFRIDSARQQLLISSKNREISDVRLRETVVQTVRQVKNAYWDLVYAISFLEVQNQSLELAEESLRNNETRVEVGTMAPIDIVEAEAEVARNEEAVILAEASVEQAGDQLRALILDPDEPEFWNLRLEPTDSPTLQLSEIDTQGAVTNALDKRTDLRQSRKNAEATDINIRYFENQILPQINIEANYGLAGLGGTQLIRGDGFPGPVIGETNRSFGSVLSDVVANDFPTWTVGVTVSYPLGTSAAEAGLERSRLQWSQVQTQIRNLELQVTTQVRDLGRQVNTNLKRVEATRAARVLGERRLEAEQKKFEVGMSTSFIVFQAQRDLSEARNNELRATLDYNQSLVDFEAVQEASIGTGTAVTSPTQGLGQTLSVIQQLPGSTSQQPQQ